MRTRATRLYLGDILLPEAKLLIYSNDVLPDGQRRHSIGIMWDTTQMLSALAGSEGLPPFLGAAFTCMIFGIHEHRCVYIEQNGTYWLPSPSCQQCPLRGWRQGCIRFEITGTLTIGSEEEKLGFAIEIYQAFFDPGTLARNQEV